MKHWIFIWISQSTENRRVSTLESKYRFNQQLYLQQHIITPYHYNYISLQQNIVTTEYRCNNIPLKHHIVQTGYRYNSIYRQNISIHHIVRTASSEHWKHEVFYQFSFIKNKSLLFYRPEGSICFIYFTAFACKIKCF